MKKIIFIVILIDIISCQDVKHEYSLRLIEQIEQFKKEKKKLPLNLSEIEIQEKEDSPAYYQKESDSTYIIWYGTALGESKTYYSKKQKWQ
jgi:hypothetical protein